jgi:hypothetical protein
MKGGAFSKEGLRFQSLKKKKEKKKRLRRGGRGDEKDKIPVKARSSLIKPFTLLEGSNLGNLYGVLRRPVEITILFMCYFCYSSSQLIIY